MTKSEHSGVEEEASIFDMEDDEADARREAEAEADIAAGRVVPHERVAEWLRSIGTADVQPVPYSWRK